MVGCASAPPLADVPVTVREAGSTAELVADWNDLDAAAIVAAQRIEATVSRTTEVSPTHRRYAITRVTGETGEVNITRPDAGREEATPMSVTARIGRLRDEPREREFVRALAARLSALKGVEFAPLDD